MIELISKNKYEVMPWKNKLGMTSQICISPDKSSLAKNDYNWRLSWAEVSGSGPFSLFQGRERLLIIWKGDGVKLNQKNLLPFNPYFFNGTESIECELINGPVQDLGLIFNKHQVQVKVRIISSPESIQCDKNQEDYFFCACGQFRTNGLTAKEGDTLRITGAEKFDLLMDTSSKIIQISLIESAS